MTNKLRVYIFESIPEGSRELHGRIYHATILNGQPINSDGAVYALNTATISHPSVPLLLDDIRKRVNGHDVEVIPSAPHPNNTVFISGRTPNVWEHRRLVKIAQPYEESIKSALDTR